ncbi:hypothetical protein RND81_01G002700 [Saponaria officinalis]|uniref:Uncharacterized protein n=1 Tax=Saponaria officinalis TaxID=3572 RepID=A0AAW1N7V8_SAPOF
MKVQSKLRMPIPREPDLDTAPREDTTRVRKASPAITVETVNKDKKRYLLLEHVKKCVISYETSQYKFKSFCTKISFQHVSCVLVVCSRINCNLWLLKPMKKRRKRRTRKRRWKGSERRSRRRIRRA